MSTKGDFWTEASAARRYREARPYFHPVVMRLIRERLGLESGEKLDRGIDVGCGTGQSTVALLELVNAATGIDSSEQMLAHAERRDGVEYLVGAAEALPVPDSCASIVTASLAIHWFNLPVFLAEAARVLRPGGWFVTYSNGFRARMIGNPDFNHWCVDEYLSRYPSPPRPTQDPPEEAFAASRFELAGSGRQTTNSNHRRSQEEDPRSQKYTNEITFTPEQLVAYLMTQSNVVAKVEQGDESAVEVAEWLSEQVRPYFTHPSESFLFGGAITYARLK